MVGLKSPVAGPISAIRTTILWVAAKRFGHNLRGTLGFMLYTGWTQFHRGVS